MTWQSDVQDKIAAHEAAQARAKAIVEISEDLEAVVKREVGRVVSQEISEVLDILADAKRRIEAEPSKNPRQFIMRLLDKLSNRLTVISAGYASGSLPKRTK